MESVFQKADLDKIATLAEFEGFKLFLKKLNNYNDVSRRIFILVYRHGRQSSGTPKIKYNFIYTITFDYRLCFFPLNLSLFLLENILSPL